MCFEYLFTNGNRYPMSLPYSIMSILVPVYKQREKLHKEILNKRTLILSREISSFCHVVGYIGKS